MIISVILLSGLFILDKLLAPQTKAQKIAIVCAMAIVGLFQVVAYFVCAATISGVTAIIVTRTFLHTVLDNLKLAEHPRWFGL